ncbi:MAG: polyprenyl synthetase family protein [Pirellulales bacterium]
MSQVANENITKHTPSDAKMLSQLYGPVQNEMLRVEEILQQEMSSKYPQVNEVVSYGCMLGGKRLRPALLLLSAKAVGQISDNHFRLAAVVEMIHTATLVHDDILDEANTRRHLETVNTRWNNETSVLLGDFLFTHAFYLASTMPTTYAAMTIGLATNIVCEGELRQIASKQAYETSEEEYLSIIEGKTAELCACSCQLGAKYADANDASVDALQNFGHSIGIAFQIADDLLDVVGDELETGKSLGTDLEKQKPTLPVIHALDQASPEQRQQIIDVLLGPIENRAAGLQPWLDKFSSLQYAKDKAEAYIQQGCEALGILPESEAKNTLLALAGFVIMRSC